MTNSLERSETAFENWLINLGGVEPCRDCFEVTLRESGTQWVLFITDKQQMTRPVANLAEQTNAKGGRVWRGTLLDTQGIEILIAIPTVEPGEKRLMIGTQVAKVTAEALERTDRKKLEQMEGTWGAEEKGPPDSTNDSADPQT